MTIPFWVRRLLFGRLPFRFVFVWFDLWVGVYIDKAKHRVYIFPIPMLGIVIQFKRHLPAIYICPKCKRLWANHKSQNYFLEYGVLERLRLRHPPELSDCVSVMRDQSECDKLAGEDPP